MKRRIGKMVLELQVADITGMKTDAIVNAANSRLAHGGGVAGAIAQKAGPAVQQESDLWVAARGPVPTGSCAITSAGRLPARYVIHAVGPRMGDGDEAAKLKLAALSSLEMAERHNLRSIAFPAISTGIFGCPMDLCAASMLSTVIEYVTKDTRLDHIVFCLVDRETCCIFEKKLAEILKP
jgi:O-acetyl-ADP-ribose deacetylase (regulator of RNase III)